MDLNKLKKYIFKNKREQQLIKVAEEMHEFLWEAHTGNRDKQIQEGLDVITSMLNYLRKIKITNEEFEAHLDKLESYKKYKYKK